MYIYICSYNSKSNKKKYTQKKKRDISSIDDWFESDEWMVMGSVLHAFVCVGDDDDDHYSFSMMVVKGYKDKTVIY